MKVIKKGTKKKKEHRAECRECGTVVSEQADKIKWEHYPRNETLARAKCPECGAELFFYQ